MFKSAQVFDTEHPVIAFTRAAQEREGLNVPILILKIFYCFSKSMTFIFGQTKYFI